MNTWSKKKKETLRRLYVDELKPVGYIAQKLRMTVQQINNMINHEKKRGTIPRTNAKQRWAKRAKMYGQHFYFNSMPDPEFETFQEGELTIKRYPKGYARGVWPQKSVGGAV